MHHFRGKLRDGDRTCPDPANVYLDFHPDKEGGTDQNWDGYLLVTSEGDLKPGKTYTLTLVDGRSGTLKVDRLTPDDSGKYRATFVGDGPIR